MIWLYAPFKQHEVSLHYLTPLPLNREFRLENFAMVTITNAYLPIMLEPQNF